MRHSGIIEMEGGVVPMFHLFCPRLYAGFQRDKTKRASNKNLLGTNVNTFISNTRRWCLSQSCASELKSDVDNLRLATTG